MHIVHIYHGIHVEVSGHMRESLLSLCVPSNWAQVCSLDGLCLLSCLSCPNLFLFDTGSCAIPRWSATYYIACASFKLAILLPQPSECWSYMCVPLSPTCSVYLAVSGWLQFCSVAVWFQFPWLLVPVPCITRWTWGSFHNEAMPWLRKERESQPSSWVPDECL